MAILFDLDGTLLDTAPDFTIAINQLLAEHHQPTTTIDSVRPLISMGARHLLTTCFGLALSVQQQDELLCDFIRYYCDTHFKNTKPFSGIEKLLHDLIKRNTPWGIVTNKPTHITNLTLASLDYLPQTSCVVCGDTLDKAKPHPDPLLHAAKLLEVDPTCCVYIGDDQKDIAAGNAAGMTTITALYGYMADQNLALQWPANHKVQSVDALRSWIDQHG